jgi:hypothetical protein
MSQKISLTSLCIVRNDMPSFFISISPETKRWKSVIRDINNLCRGNGTFRLDWRGGEQKWQNIKISWLLFQTAYNCLESRQYRGFLVRDLGVTSVIIIWVGKGLTTRCWPRSVIISVTVTVWARPLALCESYRHEQKTALKQLAKT